MKMCVASCDTGFLLINCSRSSDSGSDITPPLFHLAPLRSPAGADKRTRPSDARLARQH